MTRSPYPGLRSFKREETDLFFGRETNIDAIVNRLAATRFVTVLGASGSGKSSLVRTGVLDALTLGLLAEAGSSWQIVDLHPGGSPMLNLARSLLVAIDKQVTEEAVSDGAAHLRRGPRSVAQWARENLAAGTNLLLLVDQFEELFRYDNYARREEAQAFVNLLLESARQRDQPIYVLLTMRSEYLGACALLDDLAEAINRGQYLTPRLKREQCRAAIEGPAAVCDIDIEPALVNRLLNDLSVFAPFGENDEPADSAEAEPVDEKRIGGSVSHLDQLARRADQLPLMQHVLNRLWTAAANSPGPVRLTLDAYDRTGGLRGSLSAHADEIMESLVSQNGEAMRGATETIFRALVSGSSVSDAVRRHTTIAELVELTGGDESVVRAIVDAFRAPGCNFLAPDASKPLTPTTLVDISHESLIRQWRTLSDWTEKEAAAGAWWRRLLEVSRAGGRLRGAPLANALQLMDEYRATAAWASRHGGGFEAVKSFLGNNRDREKRAAQAVLDAEERDRKRQQEAERHKQDIATAKAGRRRAVMVTLTLLVALGGMILLASRLYETREAAAVSRDEAVTAKAKAEENAKWAKDEAIQAALGRIGTRIQSLQSEGRWAEANAGIAKLVERLVHSEADTPTLPQSIEGPLVQALRFSWFEERVESSRTLLGDENISRLNRLATVADDGNGLSLIAASRNDRVIVYGRAGYEDWESHLNLEISPAERAQSGRIRLIAFYASGKRLAVFFEREIRLGTLAEHKEGKAQRLTFGAARPDADGDRPGDEPAATARRPSASSGTIAAMLTDSIRFIAACHSQDPIFLVADDKQILWRMNLAREGEPSMVRLVQTPVTLYAVDDSSGYYAFVERGRPEEVRLDLCGPGRSDRRRTEGTLRIRRPVQALQFASAGVLGIVDRQGGIGIVRRRGDGSFSDNIESRGELKDGNRFVAFGGVDHIWARSGTGGRLVELRDLSRNTGEAEKIVVLPSTGDVRLISPGANRWIATLGNDGKVAVYDPMPPPPSVATIAAIISTTVDSAEVPADLAKEIDGLYPRLVELGMRLRPAPPPGKPGQLGCQQALDRVIGALEQMSLGDYTLPDAKKLAQDMANICPVSGASEYSDAGLLAAVRGSVADRAESGAVRSGLPDNVVRIAAVLAARGSSFGMRLLALELLNDGFPEAAKAVQVVAADNRAPLSYSLLAATRPKDGQSQWQPHLKTLLPGRESSTDGRDHELLAIAHDAALQRADALFHAILAVRYYVEAGDRRSARMAADLKAKVSRQVFADDALQVWRKLRKLEGAEPAAVSPVPLAPVMPATRPDLLSSAYGQMADRITDPMARAEFLIFAGLQPEPVRERGAAELLKRGADAASRLEATHTKARLLEKAGRALDNVGQRQLALELYIEALSLLDSVRPANEDPDVNARAILGLLARLERAPIVRDEQLRGKLDSLSWRFVHLTWGGFRSWQDQRPLLEAALKFQDAQFPRDAMSAELRFAKASTLYWLGVAGSGDQRLRYLAQSVALFDQLAKESDGGTTDRRLRHAEAVRWLASQMAANTTNDRRDRVRTLSTARDLYESLLPEVARLKDDDYIRTATISGLSSTYDNLSNQWAFIAAGEYATPDYSMNKVAEAALSGLRAIHAHQSLYAAGRFGAIAVSARNRELWFLEPPTRHEDAWMVGLIAGAIELEKKGVAQGECESKASNPFDPRRAAPGRITTDVARDLTALRGACEDGRSWLGLSASRAYLLGRIHSIVRADVSEDAEVGLKRRTTALGYLLQAAKDDYSFAFYGINAATTDEHLSAACRRHVMNRYRHVVLRDHLEAVMPVLASVARPEDKMVLDWLREGARSEPTETTRFLPDNKNLDLDWLRKSCGFKG